MKPTVEQQLVVDAFPSTSVMKIDAAAGAAKTTTLTFVAQSTTKSGLYLAFNKAMADEASGKFPSQVMCKTTHSLAYSAVGNEYRHKLNRPRGKYVNVAGTVSEIVKFFKVKEVENTSANFIATAAKKTVAKFESSADFKLSQKCMPTGMVREHIEKLQEKEIEVDSKKLYNTIFSLAENIWEERVDTSSDVLATHDTYLKLYQLSKPKLHFDVIYLDEAQDTNDCVLDIVMRQSDRCQIVIVGDGRQAIYEWRGAINAMKKIEAPTFKLSQSFRYGQAVADVAMAILDYTMDIKGFDKIESVVSEVDVNKPYAKLFRTNGKLLFEAMDLMRSGVTVAIETDVRGFCKKLESVEALFRGDIKNVKHEDVTAFESWTDLKSEDEDLELKRMAKLVESNQASAMVSTLQNYRKPSEFEVTLTTAHKSKGREFDQVVLSDDFPSIYDEEGKYKGLSEAEQNLLYVACTRAKQVLQLNPTVEAIIQRHEMESEK